MQSQSSIEDGLDGIYAFAISVTKRAGRLLLEAVERRFRNDTEGSGGDTYAEKDNAVDLVTKTDAGGFYAFQLGPSNACLSCLCPRFQD